MIHTSIWRAVLVSAAALALAACMATPAVKTARAAPDRLIVGGDGRMLLGDRLVANDDVIIYADGNGGEKAAVLVRMQPLHPDFYRDSIVVERRP